MGATVDFSRSRRRATPLGQSPLGQSGSRSGSRSGGGTLSRSAAELLVVERPQEADDAGLFWGQPSARPSSDRHSEHRSRSVASGGSVRQTSRYGSRAAST